MKVKNIVFSGFAAAILMGVAADASAATHVVTKGYIDGLDADFPVTAGKYVSAVKQVDGTVDIETDNLATEITANDQKAPTTAAVYTAIQGASNADLDLEEVGAAGSYIQKVSQSEGQVAATMTGFDTTISANSTDNNAPTSKAVYNAIQGVTNGLSGTDTVAPGQYISTVTQSNGDVSITTESLATEITANDQKAPTTAAVYTAIQGASNADLDLEEVGAAGSYIQKVSQSEGQVAATMTGFDTTISANSTDNNAPTSKAVYDYVTNNDDDTTYTGSGYVSIDENNNITVTNVTNDADGIVTGNTELTTANAVFQYVDELTGGVLPQGCDTGNCALVKLGGNLQWVELTTPLEDGTAN